MPSPNTAQQLIQRYGNGERDFSRTILQGSDLQNARLSGANLCFSYFDNSDLSDADLRNTNLNGTHLDGTKFTRAQLIGAKLTRENMFLPVMHGTDFSQADLTSANLEECDLREADLRETVLSRTNLKFADLSGLTLTGNNLSEATLEGADLTNTDLIHANLSGANLHSANLRDARLTGANLTGARLTGAVLENADLRETIGLRLDNNYVKGAKFSPNANDPWSVLQRHYTGYRLAFTLILLALFFLPYIAQAIFWSGANQAQLLVEDVAVHLRDAAMKFGETGDQSAIMVREALSSIPNFTPCLAVECRKWPIWQVLLGAHKGVPFLVLSLALVLYNAGKGLLVWRLGPLRDEQERSSYSPTWHTYGWLFLIHRFVQGMFWLAVASFIWHGAFWLVSSVWLPVS